MKWGILILSCFDRVACMTDCISLFSHTPVPFSPCVSHALLGEESSVTPDRPATLQTGLLGACMVTPKRMYKKVN